MTTTNGHNADTCPTCPRTTTVTPAVEPLSEADLLALEVRPYDDIDGRRMARLTVAERDALCQSLRAAWKEIERQRAVHDQGVRRLREMEADRDRERVRANLEQRVKQEAQDATAALREQLAQVTKELSSLKDKRGEP